MKLKAISCLMLAVVLVAVAFVMGRIQGERIGSRSAAGRGDRLEGTVDRTSNPVAKKSPRVFLSKGGLERVQETLRASRKSSSSAQAEPRPAEAAHEVDEVDAGERALAELRQRFASDDVEQRRAVLVDVRKTFSDRPQILDDDSSDDDGTSETAKREACLVRDLVEAVVAGLSDPDETVRNEALTTAFALNGDEGNMLMSRIMTTGDEGLKNGLLELTVGTPSAKCVKVSLMGLGAAEESVRMTAADNLEKLTGTKFATQDEAYEWWESNHADFLLRAAGVSKEDNVTTIVEPVPEEIEGNDGVETISKPTPNGE